MGKAFVAKPEELGSELRTHMMEHTDVHKLSSDLYNEHCAMCGQAHTQINKCNFKIKLYQKKSYGSWRNDVFLSIHKFSLLPKTLLKI